MSLNKPKYHTTSRPKDKYKKVPSGCALKCEHECSTCEYRLIKLTCGKCGHEIIRLCGDVIPYPHESVMVIEAKALEQSERGEIPPNPGGLKEEWKYYWSIDFKYWVRHYM